MVIATTGGGAKVIADLLSVPGGSNTVLEANVPYSHAALQEYLGRACTPTCSPRTARAMAMIAYQRAELLRQRHTSEAVSDDLNILGIGCTAALVTDRPKQGKHRTHVSLQTYGKTQVASLIMNKGQRDRAAEEQLVADFILNHIAKSRDLDEQIHLTLADNERTSLESSDAPPSWSELLTGQRESICVGPTLAFRTNHHRVVFPGSFDPLHEGHRQMADYTTKRLQTPVEFELSVTNVEKPLLDFIEIETRLSKFAPTDTIWLTRAASFLEKTQIFPKAVFVVGADTIIRIADTKFYGFDENARQQALATIAESGCRFLVFGRSHDHQFHTLSELKLPDQLQSICDEVPANDFHNDISSTSIRQINNL